VGGGDSEDYFIAVDIEKNDTDPNDGNNDGDEGSNNDSTPSTPTGIITPTKTYLYIDEFSRDGIGHQSAACYGDYAFFISMKMKNILV
jgi:hypothetical protein